MENFTSINYNNYYNKKILKLKNKDELIELYTKDFKINSGSITKLLGKIKTKNDIIDIIIKKADTDYITIIKKKYKTHIEEYTDLSNKFTIGKLNDETKEVRDRIHSIHDFIRNKGFGYGMTGLKLFNLFYGLLQIEKSNILNKWTFSKKTLAITKLSNEKLKEKLSFNNMFNYINEYDDILDKDTDKAYEISELIKELCEILNKFNRGDDSKLKNLVYYDLSHIKANAIDIKHLLILIKELDKLTVSSNIQLGGKIYEYFIGRDQTAISELGAYFTDRHLVNYIFKKMLNIKNSIDIDNLPKICDMFGGSGGFTINYIVYVNKILTKKNYNENDIYNFWKKNINCINHFDVNQDVVNNAKLEAFCLTHQLISKSYFNTRNSFIYEYTDEEKYDLIISNPPYGGDKGNETSKMKEYETIIKYNNDILYPNNKNLDDNVLDDNVLDDNELDDNELDDNEMEERSKLLLQNVILEEEIKFIKEEQKKKCINYSSCSKYIKDYCDKITEFYNEYLDSIGKKGIKKSINSFNDKESCSFVLLMALCAKGGRVLGVLKEGVFFDNKYVHIRRYLLNHFIVKRIDSNPSDAFENTTTKTSNILFELPNDEIIPDDYNIEFYDVEVIKNTENEFISDDNFTYLNSANNGTIKSIKSINKKVVSVKSILDNDTCSFNSKEYDVKSLIPGKGFKMVKLGDICEFLPKSKRNAQFASDNGEYSFYTSSEKVKRCNIADYNTNAILIGTHGNISIHLTNNNFSCTSNTLIFINKKYNINYLYYVLNLLFNNITNNMNGSVINFISKKYLLNLDLPIPDSDKQLEYWVNYISEPYNKLQNIKSRLISLEEKVQNDIQTILDNNDCEEVMLNDLCEFKSGVKSTMKDQYIKKGIYGYIRIQNLNDNDDFIYLTKEGYNKCKNCIVNIGDILLSDVSEKTFVKIVPEKWKNYVHYGSVIRCYNIKINKKILYYFYNSNIFNNQRTNLEIGSIQKHLTLKILKQIKIQLPKDRKLLDTLNPLFEEIDNLNEELPKEEKLYKSRLEELKENAIIE